METELQYNSLGIKLFDLWRIYLFGIAITLLVLTIIGITFIYTLIIGISICVIVTGVLVYSSYINITRSGNDITIQNQGVNTKFVGIKSIETWWQYDIGISSNVISWGDKSQSRAHINKINVLVEIRSDQSSIQLYEQIHMSGKFPNNHKYRMDKSIHRDRLFRVGDIDKCIAKLQLDDFLQNAGH